MNYVEKLFGLSGQTAVVIGGTGELCGAMGVGLAKAGAEVVIVGRNQDKAVEKLAEIEEAGGLGYFIPCDVGDADALRRLLDQVLEKSGKVDILVNGAGINSPTPFFDIPEEEFQRIFDVNLKAVLLACQIFGKHMVDRGEGGSIINVGSISGLNPLSRVFTYSATKGAVHNLSKNLAREWAPHRVRVNVLVPGFFPAEQNRKVLTPDRVADIMKHTPMDRFGEKDELIGATLLLASGKAGSFVTGTETIVDGGYSAMTI
ncbi:MAG: gluconate 5-dehydrogenase [Opitutae bacterium]|nr:gluconate 5-dehydrogenase [Opitutae bacterium]|tara:strand:+ start:3083 stop:3862 length:780 start_codon:yes stop_codon:yes gene_type:complete